MMVFHIFFFFFSLQKPASVWKKLSMISNITSFYAFTGSVLKQKLWLVTSGRNVLVKLHPRLL